MLLAKAKQGEGVWSEFKKRGGLFISSTEIASIFYLNKHRSKNQLWLQKKGVIQKRAFDSQATQHGRNWEPYAIRKFIDLAFQEEDWVFLRPGSVKDPEDPVCFSPDLMVCHKDMDVLLGLEVKCPFSAPIPARKEDIPPEYLFQAFCCLMVSRADRWFLSFYDSGTDRVTSYEIEPDSDLWRTEILPPVRAFLSTVSDNSARDPPFKKRKGKEEKDYSEGIKRKLLSLTKKREDLSD